MMLTRITAILFLSLLIACQLNPDEQTSGPASSSKQDSMALQDRQQDYASFSRLHSSSGQTIYVPVYSHIYQLNHKKTFNLTATLSIRNADINRSLILTKVLYYDSQGKIVKDYLENSIRLNPLASISFVVEENDLRGGVGANFIVSWDAENPVYPPVVEAVMISTSQQQGISFVSQGRVLSNQPADSLNSK